MLMSSHWIERLHAAKTASEFRKIGTKRYSEGRVESPAGRRAEFRIAWCDAATEAAELAEYTSLESRLLLLSLSGN